MEGGDDDDALLAAWRAGDKSAGERLLARHFETIRRFFVNKVRDDPEGLIQDTFLACVEGRDRYEGRSLFKYFLLGIARNILRQHWGQQRVQGRTEDIDAISVAELGAGPSTIMGRNRDEKRLLDALRRIPLVEQEILELYFWERLTGPELGDALELSESGARSRLRKAKNSLAKEYRRMERFAGVPESSEGSIEGWAMGVRDRLRNSGDR
jgi:RNA polymerase sigma factor (sigma-70 family)